MNKLVEAFLQQYQTDYGLAYELALQIAVEHPELVYEALEPLLLQNKPSTIYRDLFSYLPVIAFNDVVSQALQLSQRYYGHQAAQDALEAANFQAVHTLHPHLDELFDLDLYGDDDISPWRESGTQHFNYLQDLLSNRDNPIEERIRAWDCLLETRETAALKLAANFVHELEMDDEDFQFTLLQRGYEIIGEKFKPLYVPDPLHITFPFSYWPLEQKPSWLKKTHPTWRLTAQDENTFRFGGVDAARCRICDNLLHRLIILDPLPAQLGVTGVEKLTLAVCLSCLGWDEPVLFYQHTLTGTVQHIGYDGGHIEPKYPAEPLQEVMVHLVNGGARWRWQDWGHTNTRENLHRVGGYPCWIQNVDYPRCVLCHHRMQFLMQLDSELTTVDGGEWAWGIYGLGYTFWCDSCKVSAYLLQHT